MPAGDRELRDASIPLAEETGRPAAVTAFVKNWDEQVGTLPELTAAKIEAEFGPLAQVRACNKLSSSRLHLLLSTRSTW